MKSYFHGSYQELKALDIMNRLANFVCIVCMASSFIGITNGEVIYHPILPGEDYGKIDFDEDGSPELIFHFYSLIPLSVVGGSGTDFYAVFCSKDTELLLESSGLIALFNGTEVSEFPEKGEWKRPTSSVSVWSYSWSINERIGIGMPGFGKYIGVRYKNGEEWDYGWVMFSFVQLPPDYQPQPGAPKLSGYAKETETGTPLITGTRPVVVPETTLELKSSDLIEIHWPAEIGKEYYIQRKRSIAPFDWETLAPLIAATSEMMTSEFPISESAQFYRVIEAD